MTNDAGGAQTDDLTRVLDAYALDAPRVSRIRGGLLHQSFAVSAGDAEYILQRFNTVFSIDVNENIAAVTRHLELRGITTLRLVETTAGRPYAVLGEGDVWRLMTRLPGVSFDACRSPEQARRAGALVGSFHAALADFQAELAPLGFAFHDTKRHLDDLEAALRDCKQHPLHADVAALAGTILEAGRTAVPDPSLPRRVVHGDLKFNNLLFAGEGPPADLRPIALVDLDTVSRMPLCFDWGDAWRSWCNRRPEDEPRAELDLAVFRAATEGFMETITPAPTRAELESLTGALELLCLEIAARFATDALRESYFGWNREKFARAGEHNLSRTRGQLDLYRQARETHDERARLLLG